jgi:hypothetical protein
MNLSKSKPGGMLMPVSKPTMMFMLCIALSILGCVKSEAENEAEARLSGKDKASVSTLLAELPGGRANFTFAFGRFQTSTGQAAWVRLANITFSTNGTVTSTYTGWYSTSPTGKTALNMHTCSVDPAKPYKTCTQHAPTGWLVGGSVNPSYTINGVYTYDSATGALHIAWGTGAVWENWALLPVTGKSISQVNFVSSSPNYGITHGYGYGSNASWSTYKTVNQVPRVNMTGNYAYCAYSGKAGTSYIVKTGAQNKTFGLMGGVTGGNSIHMKISQSEDACTAGCFSPSTGNTGFIEHLSSLNTAATARKMIYNHHCACIPNPDQYPCYDGTIHPYAMMQVIDDDGEIQGLVGIHEQDQPGSIGFNYSIHRWLFPNS